MKTKSEKKICKHSYTLWEGKWGCQLCGKPEQTKSNMKTHIKKIGKFNLLEDNDPCTLPCKCGWNIWVGGLEKKDYKWLKKVLEEYETFYETRS